MPPSNRLMPAVALTLLFALCSPLVVAPHAATLADSEVAQSLDRLGRSLDRLAAAVEALSQESVERDKLDRLNLAIAYLNLRTRRIELLQQDIVTFQNRRERAQETLIAWQNRIRELDAMRQNGPLSNPSETRLEHQKAQTQSDILTNRVSSYNDQISLTQNMVYELQSQLLEIEAFVQKHLDL